MNQLRQTSLPNSQNQLSKQVSNLIQFARSENEVQIIEAIEKSVLIRDLSDWNDLLKIVAKWRLYIGIPKQEVTEELNVIVQFIASNYESLTLAEIELAYNLAIMRKLEDVEFFGYFSPLYVAKVIDSYLYYRKITMAEVIRMRDKKFYEDEERKNRPTPEKQAEDTRNIIKEFYTKSREADLDDPLCICYNFFRKHKIMKVTQADIDEAMEYAKKKVIDKKNLMYRVLNDTDDFEIKIHARNYIVKKYFDNVDIVVLLNNIKSEQFS